ncbi:MAG: DUF2092 domain-containing protein [Chitinophagales bacterium]|nr:DUF2092 domain-containing protein [Chitinophagales bacterium]
MKNMIAVLLLLMAGLQPVSAQQGKYDTVAIMILDHMSDVIGDLTSVSFTLQTRIDADDPDLGLSTHFYKHQVYFDGPDKMLVYSDGDKGKRGFYYNGTRLVYYSFAENNYAIISTPPTTIETIDTVNKSYGIDFPAADFFYPTFTDDLMSSSDKILFAGIRNVDGNECFQVIAISPEMTIQIWVANDAMNLPVKFLITRHGKDEGKQYEGTFLNWQINPLLPPSMFEFVPPPKARAISIMAR